MVGLALVVTGVALVSVPAAFVVAGAGLLAVAVFIDINTRRKGTK